MGLWPVFLIASVFHLGIDDPAPLSKFFLMFIFETERDRARTGEGQRERETQNLKQAPVSAVSTEPDAGLELMDCEIMT